MEILNAQTFKEKIFNYDLHKDWKYEGDLPSIIDFYADWCAPCRALSPILDEIAHEYDGRLRIYKIDTQRSPDLAEAFGIRSIPSILFIPQTGTPTMVNGLVPKAELKKIILDLLLA